MEFEGDQQKEQKQRLQKKGLKERKRRKHAIQRYGFKVAQKRKYLHMSGHHIVDMHFTDTYTSTTTKDVE